MNSCEFTLCLAGACMVRLLIPLAIGVAIGYFVNKRYGDYENAKVGIVCISHEPVNEGDEDG